MPPPPRTRCAVPSRPAPPTHSSVGCLYLYPSARAFDTHTHAHGYGVLSLQVEDAGTTNGTYVNNERVTARGRTPLSDGCLLSFGGPRQVVHQGGDSVRNPFMYRVLAYPPVRPSTPTSLPPPPVYHYIPSCTTAAASTFTGVRVWASWGAQDAEPPSREAKEARLAAWAEEEAAAAAVRRRLKRSAAAAAEAGSEDRAGSSSKHAREGGGGEAVMAADVNATTQPYDAVEGGGGGGTHAARGAERAQAAGRMGASTSTASVPQRVASAHASRSSRATAGAPSALPRRETERATPAAMRLDTAPPDGRGASGELRAAVSGVMEDLRCAICYEPMVNAHVLTCSHSFCGPCIFQWLDKARVAAPTLPPSHAFSHSSGSVAKSFALCGGGDGEAAWLGYGVQKWTCPFCRKQCSDGPIAQPLLDKMIECTVRASRPFGWPVPPYASGVRHSLC